jgi:transposase
MRQTHPAGERMFVDYAGQTIEFVDGLTGEVMSCQLFVAVLGALQLYLRRSDTDAVAAGLVLLP